MDSQFIFSQNPMCQTVYVENRCFHREISFELLKSAANQWFVLDVVKYNLHYCRLVYKACYNTRSEIVHL